MSADFLDSNVLVYLFDERDPRKRDLATELVDRAQSARSGVISHQVVQETLNVLTSKIPAPLTPGDAADFLRDVLAPLWRVPPSIAMYSRAIGIQDRYGYSFYDSLIIAAALEGGCDRILSEDLQDGQRIDSLVIENPFRP